MPKTKGVKHNEILKCKRCREDKQKCLPNPRGWPGTKCDRCVELKYECSEALSARAEKRLRESEERANRPLNDVNMVGFFDAQNHTYKFDLSTSSEGSDEDEVDSTEFNAIHDHIPTTTTNLSHSQEQRQIIFNPNLYRETDPMSELLMRRLRYLWGQPSTYHYACSEDVSRTICSLISVDGPQLALMDDAVNHGALAFTAADACLSHLQWNVAEFTNLARFHAAKAFDLLQVKLKQTWPVFNDATIIVTALALFLHGICTSNVRLLKFTASIIQKYHEHNTGFPMTATILAGENDEWTIRIYRTDLPQDLGLVLHHDTNIFSEQRSHFDNTMFLPSQPSDLHNQPRSMAHNTSRWQHPAPDTLISRPWMSNAQRDGFMHNLSEAGTSGPYPDFAPFQLRM